LPLPIQFGYNHYIELQLVATAADFPLCRIVFTPFYGAAKLGESLIVCEA